MREVLKPSSRPSPATPSSGKFVQVWKWLTGNTHDRQIVRAALTVGSFIFVAKFGFVIRDLLVAWKFGRSPAYESFLLAFVVPFSVINAISASLTAAFLPSFIQLRETGKQQEAQELYSGLFAWLLLISGVVACLCVALQPIYIRVVGASLSMESWNLMLKLLLLTTPAAFFSSVSSFWQSILNAKEKFFFSSAAFIFTPVISIALLFSNLNTAVALSLGLFLGAMIETLILGLLLRRTNDWLLPSWHGLSPKIRQAVGQWSRFLIGILFINAMSVVDNAMAARFAAPGSVAALNYGRKAVTFPIDLSAMAFATAILPYFSKMAANYHWKELRRSLRRCLALILAVNLPIALGLFIWAQPIVRLLYQRGEFSETDTQIVARVLSYYAFNLPFYVAFLVMIKLLSTLRERVSILWFSGIALLLDIVLNYLLSKRFGVPGIGLATTCVYLIMALILYSYSTELLKDKLRA